MSTADLIPTGRTSLVKKGQIALQVQTEYAHRPLPRITTTILEQGRVVHKVERSLEKKIDSIEEKNRMELTIRKQHAEVISIIESSRVAEKIVAVARKQPPPVQPRLSTMEQLQQIPGIHRVYDVDNEGNFKELEASEEFKRNFGLVFKSLSEIIDVFSLLPGVGITRERGVYEVERDKLYLISEGTHFYFFYILRSDSSVDYEKEIQKIVHS